MGGFFTRERFGRPQVLAALLLLVFLAQCVWLVRRGEGNRALDPEPFYRLERGLAMWKNRNPDWTSYSPLASSESRKGSDLAPPQDGVLDVNLSPLWSLIASAALLWPAAHPQTVRDLQALIAAPYLIFGVLLG